MNNGDLRNFDHFDHPLYPQEALRELISFRRIRAICAAILVRGGIRKKLC